MPKNKKTYSEVPIAATHKIQKELKQLRKKYPEFQYFFYAVYPEGEDVHADCSVDMDSRNFAVGMKNDKGLFSFITKAVSSLLV